MEVAEIMKKVVVIDSHISIKDAAKIMSKKRIGSLVIVDKDKLSGIITERDILKNISKINSEVETIMGKKVITINSKSTLEGAAEIMLENKIKRLPVIRNKKLVGIITMTDIVGHSNLEGNDAFIFN